MKIKFMAEIEFDDNMYFEAFKDTCLNSDEARSEFANGCLDGLEKYFCDWQNYRGLASIEHALVTNYRFEEID